MTEDHDDILKSLDAFVPRTVSNETLDRVRASVAPHARIMKHRPPWLRWLAPLAAAACLVMAVSIFWPHASHRSQSVVLASGWLIEPTGDAAFRVIDDRRVKLERGELHVSSVQTGGDRSPVQGLVIDTPEGAAHAQGTRFYVGTHAATRSPNPQGSPAMKRHTRVLVLAGMVTLTNPFGSITGNTNDLLAAEADKAPTKIAVQANSDFAFDLYKQLAKENDGKNLFFSPYSISGALAMTAQGARQETAAEMGKVLRFPDAAKRIGDDAQILPWETSLIHTGMSELNRKFSAVDDDPAKTAAIRAQIAVLRKELAAVKANVAQLEAQRKWKEYRTEVEKEQAVVAKLNAELSKIDQYEIRVANALWGEKTYPFDPNYVKTINGHYDTGGVFPVDFKFNFEGERLQINRWVEKKTNDRIKNLLPEGSLTEHTRLVLTNAIYFKGDWSIPFKEQNTKDLDFTLPGGKTTQVPIMHAPNLSVCRYGAFNGDGSYFNTPMRSRRGQDSKELYPKADGFAIVELPYKGDALSMVVIAPNDPVGLPAIEKQLTPENLAKWIGQIKKRDTNVYLPKFKMETEYTLGDANEPGTLQKMGMVRAFLDPRDPKTGAQFQGMTTSTDPMDQLYITNVFHKAFVQVNEKGTEAAAATAVVMAVPTSAPLDIPFTPDFKADRPFICLIRDNQTGTILFMGRVTDPSKLQ